MEEKEIFATQPVGKLLFKLAIPSIMAQLVNMIYNVVDRIFLGHIAGEGALVLAGLGIAVPIINVINAFANLVGTGGGPMVAIAMGRKNPKEAEEILGNSVFLLLALTFILTVGLLVGGDSLLQLLGADSEILPYASKYLKIYMCGNLFVMLSLGLNPFLTTQGFNKISMRNICIGAVTNIILDPILIYKFHLGIAGAAIATVISQGVTAVLAVTFILGKRTKIRLHFTKPQFQIIKNIILLGTATFFMQASESVVQAVVYNQLLLYGNSNYVAATSIMYSIAQFIFLTMQGMGQGAQPIISYNYGAKNYGRVKQALKVLLTSGTLICFVEVLLIEVMPAVWVGLFTSDAIVLRIGVYGLRIFVLGRGLAGLQLGLQEFFRSVGDSKTAIFNATARKFVFLVPLAYILPKVNHLGAAGVYWAECIADLLAVAVAVGAYFVRKKKIFREKT
jgi:putative MATE family efflux protein